MESYHLQKQDRQITDDEEIEQILTSELVITMAMCRNNIPYLVTMDYYYDNAKNAIFFHCSNKGKKIDYLKANGKIWAEIMQDHGYIKNECSHAYKSVHIKGNVKFIEDDLEKRDILSQMIHKFEQNPEGLVERFIKNSKKLNVSIGKIEIEQIWGKKNFS